ncbi:MAG: glutaredoxin family protein [Planctomycetaceae bacterium]|nr:glutaredoxin family protein [Planctomycetaceae bacterium]
MSVGSVILFVGLCGLLLSGFSGQGGILRGDDHRFLLIGVSLALIGAGIKQLKKSGDPKDGWKPSKPGVRFQRVIVYSRAECGLCDEAMEVLERYAKYFNDLSVVSIAESEELTEKYGTTIPVVEFDGEVRFQGRVDERLLRRLIEGSPVLG